MMRTTRKTPHRWLLAAFVLLAALATGASAHVDRQRLDYAAFQQCFGTTDATCLGIFDFDAVGQSDGAIDLADFGGFDPAAAWEDFKVGMEHFTRWQRVALVTDVDWIRHTMQLFSFIMPGDMRVFPTAEAAQARAWLVAVAQGDGPVFQPAPGAMF